jgi:hypothetical protein
MVNLHKEKLTNFPELFDIQRYFHIWLWRSRRAHAGVQRSWNLRLNDGAERVEVLFRFLSGLSNSAKER